MNSYYDPAYHVGCPMPGCSEILSLDWSLSLTLSPDDLSGHDPSAADCGTWKVECLAGHAVLLPTEGTGCPCEDDQGGVACPHDDMDFDWSEESRAFRASDALRLRDLISALTNAPVSA